MQLFQDFFLLLLRWLLLHDLILNLLESTKVVVHESQLTDHGIERIPQLVRHSGVYHRRELMLRFDVIIEELVRHIDDLKYGLSLSDMYE